MALGFSAALQVQKNMKNLNVETRKMNITKSTMLNTAAETSATLLRHFVWQILVFASGSTLWLRVCVCEDQSFAVDKFMNIGTFIFKILEILENFKNSYCVNLIKSRTC